jgi:diaminopimelate decarboxylase
VRSAGPEGRRERRVVCRHPQPHLGPPLIQPIFLFEPPGKVGLGHWSALAGPTCDSFDTLSLDVEIPELYVGDVVYVKNIGAYSSASAVANFNGFPPAKIVMV